MAQEKGFAPTFPAVHGHPLVDWMGLLATVFLFSAFLGSMMRWLSRGTTWDLGGIILAGLLTWLCYSWTISDKALPRVHHRLGAAIALPLVWALSLPVIMMALGFS